MLEIVDRDDLDDCSRFIAIALADDAIGDLRVVLIDELLHGVGDEISQVIEVRFLCGQDDLIQHLDLDKAV